MKPVGYSSIRVQFRRGFVHPYSVRTTTPAKPVAGDDGEPRGTSLTVGSLGKCSKKEKENKKTAAKNPGVFLRGCQVSQSVAIVASDDNNIIIRHHWQSTIGLTRQ